MKKIVFIILALYNLNSFAQSSGTLNVVPDSMKRGSYNTIVFSGSAINFSSNPCIQVVLVQGSNVIYQASSNLFYAASNILVTSFYVATNSLIGNYDVLFIDTCSGNIISSYVGKMRVKFASFINEIEKKIEFVLFPNPVQRGQNIDILFGDSHMSKNSLNIYSMDGKLLITEKNVKNIAQVNTSMLSSGTYFIEFMNNEGVKSSKKLVVE